MGLVAVGISLLRPGRDLGARLLVMHICRAASWVVIVDFWVRGLRRLPELTVAVSMEFLAQDISAA